MPAHVPRNDAIAVRERLHLVLPHRAAGPEFMAQQYCGSEAPLLVMDLQTVIRGYERHLSLSVAVKRALESVVAVSFELL